MISFQICLSSCFIKEKHILKFRFKFHITAAKSHTDLNKKWHEYVLNSITIHSIRGRRSRRPKGRLRWTATAQLQLLLLAFHHLASTGIAGIPCMHKDGSGEVHSHSFPHSLKLSSSIKKAAMADGPAEARSAPYLVGSCIYRASHSFLSAVAAGRGCSLSRRRR